jgi:flavin-dependent dehydrogenase
VRAQLARLVVAADGNRPGCRSPWACVRDDRPLGWDQTHYTSPGHDDYPETWLDLWDGNALLPGYGWIFVATAPATWARPAQHQRPSATLTTAMLRRWLASMPAEWGFAEENQVAPVRGAALPMGFNRTPHYTSGLLLVGDAGGMVNPFNGEGISCAMESGEIAAQVIVQALARPDRPSAELALRGYPQALKDAYGGYYTLGRKFVGAIGHPRFMKFATRHGLPRPALMRFT